MNQGQERFYQFILERAMDGKQEDAKALLQESFARQADGTFGAEYLSGFFPRLMALIKPEAAEEVKAICAGFASQLNKG